LGSWLTKALSDGRRRSFCIRFARVDRIEETIGLSLRQRLDCDRAAWHEAFGHRPSAFKRPLIGICTDENPTRAPHPVRRISPSFRSQAP
jgi:hypothetical protein